MSFKLWSELNTEALNELKPDFGFRTWNDLSETDKLKIWKYLEDAYFFNAKVKYDRSNHFADYEGAYYEFHGEYYEQSRKQERVAFSIGLLNDMYKAKSFGNRFLEDKTWTNACTDFYSIFIKEKHNVVFELISIYAETLIAEAIEPGGPGRYANESDVEFQTRAEEQKWHLLDKFVIDINEVFSHFGLNLYLSRLGFAPKQEEKVIKELFEPVLKSLSHPKWEAVSQHLRDAFSEYRKSSQTGFSNCVTNTVTAVQAFLQVIVNGKIGSGDISKLIIKAQKNALIPSDSFTKEIFANIESILMRERQSTGIAHPKKEYATEKNARLVLNLAMIFFQHCV